METPRIWESSQELFDYTVAALRKQGCKSKNEKDICQYRGPNGTRCAAGHTLPDSLYSPQLEEHPITSPKFPAHVRLAAWGEYTPVVRALQGVHDWHDVEEWENEFARVASNFYLVYTPPTTT